MGLNAQINAAIKAGVGLTNATRLSALPTGLCGSLTTDEFHKNWQSVLAESAETLTTKIMEAVQQTRIRPTSSPTIPYSCFGCPGRSEGLCALRRLGRRPSCPPRRKSS